MTTVIIYSNSNGNVSVCVPAEGVDINNVLKNDCPSGAIIVDDSTFPQGSDAQFFDAWVLNGLTITVDIKKAQADKLAQYNIAAIQVAQSRQLNTLAGIPNIISDADFMAKLATDRANIAAATTTAQLVAIQNPVVVSNQNAQLNA